MWSARPLNSFNNTRSLVWGRRLRQGLQQSHQRLQHLESMIDASKRWLPDDPDWENAEVVVDSSDVKRALAEQRVLAYTGDGRGDHTLWERWLWSGSQSRGGHILVSRVSPGQFVHQSAKRTWKRRHYGHFITWLQQNREEKGFQKAEWRRRVSR